MIVDFRCINDKCAFSNIIHERDVTFLEINEQECEECKCKVERVWSFAGGIKTSDGYKN